MGKLIINGTEVQPAKKVKLDKYIKPSEIQKLIRKKREEQQGEQSSGN